MSYILKLTECVYISSAMKKALSTGSSSGFDAGLSMTSEDLPDKIRQMTATKTRTEKAIEGNFLAENGVTIGNVVPLIFLLRNQNFKWYFLGQRRQKLIQQSYELNAIEDDDFEVEPELSPKEAKNKGKGKGKNRKTSGEPILNPDDRDQTLASLAKSLAAVKEDPSLLIGLEGGPMPKKGRGRPRRSPEMQKSPKKTSKGRGRGKKKKDTDELW